MEYMFEYSDLYIMINQNNLNKMNDIKLHVFEYLEATFKTYN